MTDAEKIESLETRMMIAHAHIAALEHAIYALVSALREIDPEKATAMPRALMGFSDAMRGQFSDREISADISDRIATTALAIIQAD
ncbi:hypothetical protein [Pseudogemmobacter sonorensis]|uniref:hypothetical protein n=1 Tax=Pseudogemmobacter sonorensis TaxID=2989681 RepID=UPI003687200A